MSFIEQILYTKRYAKSIMNIIYSSQYPNEVGILLVPHFISEYSLRKIK